MANKILLIFHNLNIEGAPTMLMQVARILSESEYSIEALAFGEGIYEKELSQRNIPLKIISTNEGRLSDILDNYINKFNLVIANTVVTFPIIARYNNTIPIMWYIHEGKTIKNIFEKNIPSIRSLLKSKSNIVVVSEYVRQWFESEYCVKDISVLHNYVDIEEKDLLETNLQAIENKVIHFTYLGTIDNHKGLDILLEANHRLEDKSRVFINYAGNILDKRFYNTIISRYDEENIKYWGIVTGTDKVNLFRQTDVFVVPSRDESCSLVVLEAFAAHKPVIISDQVGAKYLLNEKCGWEFSIHQIDELKTLLADIACQKYNLREYGDEGRKQYDYYVSYDKYKNELLQLVEKWIDKRDVHQFMRCTDCGACRQSCPTEAISQRENEEGFLYPWIDYSRCIHCGKCVDICPVITPDYSNLTNPKCYAGYASDDIRLNRSSSGGAFAAFSNTVLKKDGYVSGVVFDEQFRACHIVSNDPSDIMRMRGAKYVQSNTGNVFRKIEQLLIQNKMVLFTGVSCQVAGLKSYLGKEYDNLICIDIICHGVPSPGIFQKYLKEIGIDKIRDIQFRDKSHCGWRNSNLHIGLETKSINQSLNENSYTSAFLNGVINRQCCAECQFQKIPRQGDISIGDFWGIEYCDPELDDDKGISVILANSEKGEKFLEETRKGFLVLKEESLQDVVKKNPNLISPSMPHPDRSKFFEYNKRFSVDKCVRKILYGKTDAVLMNYWYAKNYGAILTCYALYHVLDRQNIMISLLNYIPNAYKAIYENSFAQRFAEQHMDITKQCLGYGDLLSLNDITDTFIVGSDQVWNYHIYSEHGENIFQLDYTAPEKRRIACSVSFGSNIWDAPKMQTEKFNELIKDFHAISVREESGKTLLENTFHIKADILGDPVFALKADEWRELSGISPLCVNNYFAYYFLSGGHADIKNQWIYDIIGLMEEKLGSKPFGLEYKQNYTVEEWVNIIDNSELVVTDSFYAVCFSIIFNKPFVYLVNNVDLYPRLENLFQHYKLNATIVTEDNYKDILNEKNNFDIDYQYANAQMAKDAIYFKDWIMRALKTEVQPVHNELIRELLVQIHKKEADNQELKEKVVYLGNENENLRTQNNEIKVQIHQLNDSLSEMKNSTIWKTTKPLRCILDRLKR